VRSPGIACTRASTAMQREDERRDEDEAFYSSKQVPRASRSPLYGFTRNTMRAFPNSGIHSFLQSRNDKFFLSPIPSKGIIRIRCA